MNRRSFSFLLARRYLNPRRSMLSSFTLISLTGVMLGVLVLVVVMAVYAGMERDLKSRLLGYSPHILFTQQGGAVQDREEALAKVKQLPDVENASAYVADNVILDFESWQKPIFFHGVDPSDPSQLKGLNEILDRTGHPESTVDLGIDDRAVISSTLVDQFAQSGIHLGVGDSVRLYSTRNFQEVMRIYKSIENPPVRELFADDWKKLQENLAGGWKPGDSGSTIAIDVLSENYRILQGMALDDIRDPEREMIDAALVAMEAGDRDDVAGVYRFTPEAKTAVDTSIAALAATDRETMDCEVLKGLKSIVLPKSVEIVGVYKASQMASMPDIFVPLPLAQDLAGLGDAVQGISIRLKDPYLAEIVAKEGREKFGEEWSLRTWGDQHGPLFALIRQQRVMMYFALSFIVLVSAFSMMAVMFTVTIQKRREIGVMKALGAAPGQIVRVFLYQGMILGLGGACLGVVLGRLVIAFRGQVQTLLRHMGFDPFSSSFTGFDTLPAHNNPLEQAVIAFMAFVLCSLAALLPAFFAARSDAAKSLRNL